MAKNINEEGYDLQESPYKKKNEEEAKKLPVEYLGYVERRRAARMIKNLAKAIILVLLLAFGPGIRSKEYCPECGRFRTYATLAWGNWTYSSIATSETEWTRWYESRSPLFHEHHWVLCGKVYPAIFTVPVLPWGRDLGWEFPENLVTRMKELERYLRLGKILNIPRTLNRVSNAKEWNAIILPLTVGTPEEAFEWWKEHEDYLTRWSKNELAELSEDFISASEKYVEEKLHPEGNEIPILPE